MYTCAGLCHICAVDEPEKLIHMDWLVLLTEIIPIAMRRKECVQVHVHIHMYYCTCTLGALCSKIENIHVISMKTKNMNN